MTSSPTEQSISNTKTVYFDAVDIHTTTDYRLNLLSYIWSTTARVCEFTNELSSSCRATAVLQTVRMRQKEWQRPG